MPKIPVSSFSGKISSDVPQITPDQISGAPFQALANLGKGVQDFGVGVDRLIEARQKATSDDFMQTEKTNFVKGYSAFKESQDASLSGTGHEGYTETNQSYIENNKNLAMGDAPNDQAKERVKQFYGDFSLNSFVSDSAYENKQRGDFYKTNFFKNRDEKLNTLSQFTSLKETEFAFREFNKDLNDSNLFDSKEKLSLQSKNSDFAETFLNASLAKGSGHLIEAEAFLKSNTDLSRTIDPKAKISYLSKIENLRENEFNKVFRTSLSNVDNAISLMSLKGQDPNTKAILDKSIRDVQAFQNLPGVDNTVIEKAINRIQNAKDDLSFNSEIKGLRYDQIVQNGQISINHRAALAKDTTLATAGDDLKVADRRAHLVADYVKAIQSDPVKVAVGNNPNLAQGTQDIYDYQVSMGYPNPDYFSKDTGKNIMGSFKMSKDKKNELDQFQSEYGEIGVKWLNKKSSEGDKEASVLALAASMDDPYTKYLLLNIKDKEVKTLFESDASLKENTPSIIDESLNEHSKGFRGFFNTPSTAPFANVMNTKMQTEVRKLMLEGYSLEDASKNAYKTVIENNIQLVSTDTASVIPLIGKYNDPILADKVKSFIKGYSNSIKQNSFGNPFNETSKEQEQVAKELNIAKDANGLNFPSDGAFMKFVSENEPKFEIAPTGDGLILTYVNPQTERRQRVKGFVNLPNKKKIIQDKTFSFDEIQNSSSEFEAMNNHRADNNSLIGKLKKMVKIQTGQED